MKNKNTLFLLLLILITILSFSISAQDYASESSCVDACSDRDYKSALSCYKEFRDTADSYLAVGNCAFNNGDDKDAEKYALKSATYRGKWITLIANKVPGINIRTGGTASSYALAYVATEKQEHKENAIRYARTSGQCQGADDVDECAEYYFNSSILNYNTRDTITARNTNPHLAKRSCDAKTQYQSWLKKKCECRDGFVLSANECVLAVHKTLAIGTNAAFALEDAFSDMKKGEAVVKDVTITKGPHKDKKKMAIGKTASGSPIYSFDGIKWEKNIVKVLEPSMRDKASGAWNSFTTAINPLNWFETKYKDDYEGQHKQAQYEIAKNLRAEFIKDGQDPKILEEQLWDKYQEAKSNDEKELQLIQDLLEKGFLDTAKDMSIDSVKSQMWDYFVAFPAESVKKFANEASDTDFFQAVYYYNQYRIDGQSAASLASNPPDEIIALVSIATIESFGENTFWIKLEEGYNRYLAYKELKGKK